MKEIIAARIFALLVFGAILFQILLAFGMPWGEFAWGGGYPGTLPIYMRIASLIQALLLFIFAIIVLVRAGFFFSGWRPIAKKLVWVVVVYCGLGVIANAVTPSLWERIIWLPVLIISFASSLVVAKGR